MFQLVCTPVVLGPADRPAHADEIAEREVPDDKTVIGDS
jgi:hypothetical protein